MADQYLLALDAGTGSVRAVLFDATGQQLGCSQQEWFHKEDPRFPGSMDFDWVHNWHLASGCVREVLSQTGVNPHAIAAISTTCMREGIVLYDAQGQEIWACANVDARSGDEVAELKMLDSDLEKDLYKVSGQTYALGALPRLLWVKNKLPDVYEKTATMSMFNDWLIYKLTGVMVTEPSNGCTTGVFDLSSRSWDVSIAQRCGLKDDIFPPARECGTVVAAVSELGAAQTGLAAGTPVVTGGGDAQLGCIGVGLVEPNQAAVFGGSFWQYEYNTASAATDPFCRVRVNCHAVPGLWQYEAIAFMPGLAMRWYRDAFCQAEKEKAKELNLDAYQLMNAEAEKIPAGCYGMMCSFSDVMNYISWRHAAPTFGNFDFNPDKFNRYTFYRAIMENAALVTRGHMDLVRESSGGQPKEIIFASGAAKSPLWCQIVADVMGLPVKVPKVKEATALGAAILAGYGVGIYESMKEAAANLVKWEAVYHPDPENKKIYDQMYTVWRKFYQNQLELSDQRVTRYMWAAPGL